MTPDNNPLRMTANQHFFVASDPYSKRRYKETIRHAKTKLISL